jgi:choline kinase
MKAILLCAGRGRRLDPLTRDQPKCLVRVGGKAILDHQVGALCAAGVEEVVVVGGYRFEQLQRHVAGMQPRCRVRLIANPHWASTSSIGSVRVARNLLEGPFCILNGDTVFEDGLLAGVIAAAKPGLNLVVEEAPSQPDDMRVTLEGDRIVAVGKRLAAHQTSARSLGVVICPKAGGGRYRAALDVLLREPRGDQLYHHDVVDRIARAGRVHPVLIRGYDWQEIDRVEDILAWERRSLRNAA